MSDTGPRPPRFGEHVVRALLPADVHGRTIVGDLYEEYGEVVRSRGRLLARLWYWRQVAVLGLTYARPRSLAFSDLGQDLRHSLRGLGKTPVFTLSVVLTIALAVGAGTAIFSVVDAVLLRPLPFERPEELVRVWASDDAGARPYVDMMYSDVEQVRNGVGGFVSVTGFSVAPRTLLDWGMENPEDVTVARTSTDFLKTLGVEPTLGRAFTWEEAARGESVALISHGLWQRRFAADPAVIGSMVHVDTDGYEIIGVLPDGVQYPDGADFWRPLAPDEMEDDDREVQVIARLAEDVTLSAVTSQVRSLAAGLAELNPETHGNMSAWVQPLQAMVVRDVRTALSAFLGAVGLVLLIACVNTANLLLARSTDRRHEIAVRTSLGAGRGRVVRAQMTESLVLAALGGALGLLIGQWVLRAILVLTPPFPRLDTVALDMRVVAVMAVVAAAAGILAGVGPALHAASTAPGEALREGGAGRTGAGGRVGLQSGLVATEVALSTVLAVLAVLLFSTFRTVVEHDRGFSDGNLFAFQIEPFHPPAAGDETRAYFGSIMEGVLGLPTVQGVALSSHPVLEQRGLQVDVQVEGRPRSGSPAEQATLRIVSRDFLRTVGIPLRFGRSFDGEGGTGDDVELLVNETFVRRYLADGTDALGAFVSTDWARGHVVGVTGDVAPTVGEPARPIVYVPFARFTLPGAWLLVRGNGDTTTLARDVWREVLSVDRYVLSTKTVVLEEAVRASVAPERFNMLILVAFSSLALGLAAIGIYGVTSYSVSMRREEIGIRRALGASRPRVASDVLARIARLMALGVAAGVTVAVAGGRLVGALLVGVEPTDPRVLFGAAALLAVVSMAAAAVPAFRAIHITPTQALRGK